MKKVLVTLMAVATLAAFAGTASAVTCTIDHKPSATLLIPYFQTTLTNNGGTIQPSGATGAVDTLVTVANASSDPILAHVTVWNRASVAVLDFNIPLTGFDELSWSMGQVLSGNLPNNPSLGGDNACADGFGEFHFVKFDNGNGGIPTAGGNDSSATTVYDNPVFNSAFALVLAGELDGTDDCAAGGETALSADPDTLTGYVTIDMVNYCSFINPNDTSGTYYERDVIGFENALWGEYDFLTVGGGAPTYGQPAIGLEADTFTLNGDRVVVDGPVLRTFYARYWEAISGPHVSTVTGILDDGASFGASEASYMAFIGMNDPTHIVGDMREPLGISYGARYFDNDGLTSFLRAWRASAGPNGTVGGIDLTGPDGPLGTCSPEGVEPNVLTVIWDEDETPAQKTGCTVSPCPPGQHFNFPFETQRVGIEEFAGAQNHPGWIYVDFADPGTDTHVTDLDQAWLGYDLVAPGAFTNAGIDGVSFDRTTCNPVGLTSQFAQPVIPVPLNADGNTGSGSF